MKILAIHFKFNWLKYDYVLGSELATFFHYLLSSTCFWQVVSAKF